MNTNTQVLDFAIKHAKTIIEDVKRFVSEVPDGQVFGVFLAEMKGGCLMLAPRELQKLFLENQAKTRTIAMMMMVDADHQIMSCDEHGQSNPDVVFIVSKGSVLHNGNIRGGMPVTRDAVSTLLKDDGTTVLDAIVIQMHTISGFCAAHAPIVDGVIGEMHIHDPRERVVKAVRADFSVPDITPTPATTLDPFADGSRPTLH
jgi:hypothetical protein